MSLPLQLDVGAPQRLQLLPSNCAGCHCGGGQLAAADYCAAAPRKSAARRGRLSHRRSSRASEDKARGPQLLEHPPAPLVTSHLDKSTTALSDKNQLLRDSSWLRTQLLATYGRADDPQWRRSCSCDGGWGRLSSARRSILRRMRGWHVAFLWRTYPTYRQYSGACVVHTLIASSGAGGPTVATERGVGAQIRRRFSYTSENSVLFLF